MTRKTVDSDATDLYTEGDPWSPEHERTCPQCGKYFRTYQPKTRFCSILCKRQWDYRRWRESHPESYANHKKRMRLQQQARRILAQADSLKKGNQ